MAGSTPIYGFRYPDPSDLVANYPALGQELAQDMETVLTTYSTWPTYVPVITGTGWAIGNGTITGRYARLGKTVHMLVLIVWGSSSTFGAGGLRVSMPVESTNHFSSAIVDCFDASLGVPYFLQSIQANSTTLTLQSMQSSIGKLEEVISSKPMTWASGDFIRLYYTYRAV